MKIRVFARNDEEKERWENAFKSNDVPKDKQQRNKITVVEEKNRLQIQGDKKSLIALHTILKHAFEQNTQATRHIVVNNILKNVVITCIESEKRSEEK